MATDVPDWITQLSQGAPSAAGALSAPPSMPAWVTATHALNKSQPFVPASPTAGGGNFQIGPWDTGLKTPQWLDRGLAGAGEASMNLLRGAGERVGLVSKGQIAQDQKYDAPLNATTAGKVGNIAGGIVDTLPAMFIPGANTLTGGALIGSGLGTLTPTTNNKQLLANVGIGGMGGGLGTVAGNALSKLAGRVLANRASSAASSAAMNSERDAALSAARSAGYRVPPTAIRPNLVNTALESVSGKAATRQGAEATNQSVTNRLVARDLNLPANRPISPTTLKSARKTAGAVYDQVKQAAGTIPSDAQYQSDLQAILGNNSNLATKYPGLGAQVSQKVTDLVKSVNVPSHDGEGVVDLSKFLRAQAKTNFQKAFRGGDPESLELAQAQQKVANSVENLIGRHLQASNQGQLAQQWAGARQLIAKSYQAGAALKGNNVSALKLASQLDKGGPSSGGMDLAARFAQQFPEVSRIPKSGVGVSKLAAMLGMAGEGTGLWLHSPETMAGSAALMAAPYATRAAILSRLGQRALATPKYTPNLAGTLALKALQVGGRSKALPGAASVLALHQ